MNPQPLGEFLALHAPELLRRTGEHLWLTLLAIGIAAAIGIPLGVAVTRRPRLERWALGFANVVQTIPSLALFGFLIPIPLIGGIGARSAVIALTLYALLPILRNAYEGVRGVDPSVRESALAMGMTDWQLLRLVELPLAAPLILAGLRVATVTCVGVTTIAALIGAGGLGTFIFTGLQTVNARLILLGAVPSALLALAADFGLGWAERRIAR
ncbi:MAG: ABC transporter permease subunit [Acidobacteria bacterium]|nr:ABC transporter permease subunit [Acidobacteriota bacterium]